MGLVRRLLIWAAVDGVVLQAHGSTEAPKAIQIDYKSRRIRELQKSDASAKRTAPLEAHGIVGLLSIASSSFLVAITQREQVAQIFGKPIYVITDVAILPLSSQDEATLAITAALESQTLDSSSTDTDTDVTDIEDNNTNPQEQEEPETPVEHELPGQQISNPTSIARDVIAKRGQYGRFAAQWFSRQGWGGGKTPDTTSGTSTKSETLKTASSSTAESDAVVAANQLEASDDNEAQEEKHSKDAEQLLSDTSITEATSKILRRTKMILTSRSYFFSYEFDLTRRLAVMGGSATPPSRDTLDPMYFWNRRLLGPFMDARQDSFMTPILQGFVGQRIFTVTKAGPENPQSACVVDAEHGEQSAGVQHAINHAKQGLASISNDMQSYLLTLISRRSVKRSGLRYLRRGLDDEGNCANAVETEQILSAPDWSPSRRIRSFVQIRASIPLYFSQSPYSLKPTPMLHQSPSKNDAAMKKHFQDLRRRYGGVQVVCLVDKHGPEVIIGDAFEKKVHSLQESNQLEDVLYEWFDFHAECRGMKFENVSRLVDKLENTIKRYGETVISKDGMETSQSGVIRTNCMDCLDRTNVAQSAFGQYMLQRDLGREGFEIDLLHDDSTTWFNTLWADNGDAISRQYASTAALKGDFTRTRRRNYRGALNDFSLTLTRFYNNMVNDYFSQAVIDFLLGNVSWRVFEDFESSMMSKDPGISIDQARQAAIESCAKQVIQEQDEDLIHGWTMLAPAHENTLRTMPFEEAVVLLTDAALYCCRFDWTTEKLASFEKVDLRSISKIRYGTYITSTFSERQMKEELNAGLVVIYQPGKGSTIRTNTRSLQNYVAPKTDESENRIDGGTGILSWLSPASAAPSRKLAMKVIPAATTDSDGVAGHEEQAPLAVAENIADEIRRALTGSTEHGELQGTDLVEQSAIISLEEAKKRVGYLEQLGHSIKKMVWT
ncbi:uncharacterized protein Z519_05585 [Cladophialophora bantiana CBS 173.52]|uniref:SAC domain-containing protein n=1 Tax=Cladophialophora bantiana (strain ATCC 10958 / CBS 173.52 / CDC B-1940 / NIH 8579) TaxID=1442370 RepID=A0A0D2IBT7_CLAB1|nr:uncharacterized protein Z519_05585 [Cladophialophora bantiana CBS 173.52]KIW94269.1 hypothetical protein Z519_05585 [Cladophialophora bantiana CBS 173.52]